MSTNYYLRTNVCKSCERYDEIHIGKMPCGMKYFIFCDIFNSNIYIQEINVKNLWKSKTKGKEIYDEYGTKISYKEFWKMIDKIKVYEYITYDFS